MSILRRMLTKKRLEALTIKCHCTYGDSVFKFRVNGDTTIGGLVIKLVNHASIAERIVILIDGRLYSDSVYLSTILNGEVLLVVVSRALPEPVLQLGS